MPKEIHFSYYGKWINNGIHMVDLIFYFSNEKKIDKVYFDRGENKYHGRVKLFADTLRKNGLKF